MGEREAYTGVLYPRVHREAYIGRYTPGYTGRHAGWVYHRVYTEGMLGILQGVHREA